MTISAPDQLSPSYTLAEAETEIARRLDLLLADQLDREIDLLRECGYPVDDEIAGFTAWRRELFSEWRTDTLAKIGRALREPDAPSLLLQ